MNGLVPFRFCAAGGTFRLHAPNECSIEKTPVSAAYWSVGATPSTILQCRKKDRLIFSFCIAKGKKRGMGIHSDRDSLQRLAGNEVAILPQETFCAPRAF
jgi:hypothetical protein